MSSRVLQHKKHRRRRGRAMGLLGQQQQDLLLPSAYRTYCPMIITAASIAGPLLAVALAAYLAFTVLPSPLMATASVSSPSVGAAAATAVAAAAAVSVAKGTHAANETAPIDFPYPEGMTEAEVRQQMANTPGRMRAIQVWDLPLKKHVPNVIANLQGVREWCKGLCRNKKLLVPILERVNLYRVPLVNPVPFELYPRDDCDSEHGLRPEDRAEMERVGVPPELVDETDGRLGRQAEDLLERNRALFYIHVPPPDALPVVRLDHESESEHHPVVIAMFPVHEGKFRTEVKHDGMATFFRHMLRCWQQQGRSPLREKDVYMEYGFAQYPDMYDGVYLFFMRPITEAYRAAHGLKTMQYYGNTK